MAVRVTRCLFLGVLCWGWGIASVSPATAEEKKTMAPTPKPQNTVHPEILRRYCHEPYDHLVTILRNDAGHIGGYKVTQTVMDAPVRYFDAQAHRLGTFHVLEAPEENAKSKPAIDDLLKRFPVQRPLECRPVEQQK
jgi:hypothetical protein